MPMMQLFGLIGFPLGHSFSKQYFSQKFTVEGITNARYELFPLPHIQEFPALCAQNPQLKGLNVTIPHKETVIPYLYELDEEAHRVGAVNTIAFLPDGRTKGYNTDVYGFEQTLLPLLQPHHTHALVLGTGGAAKAVIHVLSKLGLPFLQVSRQPGAGQLHYRQIDKELLQQYTVVVNTTPLGMYPNTQQYPNLPYQHADSRHLFYDLVYNPPQTLFLAKAAQQGATTQNGLAMLHLQAQRAWQIWNS